MEKLRATLHKNPDLVRETERIVRGVDFYKTLGGLLFDIRGLKDFTILIEHSGGDDFDIFVRRNNWTALATHSKFKDLELSVRTAIAMVRQRA